MDRYKLYGRIRLNLGLKRWFLPRPDVSFLVGLLAPRRLRLPAVSLADFLGAAPPVITFCALHDPVVNTPPDDLVPICTLAKAVAAKRILEVGTYNGASAINLALACPEANITTYDVRAEAGEKIATTDPAIRARIERRVANFAHDGDRLRAEPPYDLIFIDGDHKAPAVEADSALAFERITPGGIIAWHDYRHVGHEWLSCENLVPEVLNRLAARHAIRHLLGTTVAVLRWPKA